VVDLLGVNTGLRCRRHSGEEYAKTEFRMAGPRNPIREFYTGDYRALEGEFVSLVREVRSADALSPLVVIVTSRLLGLHLRRHLAEKGTPHINVRFFTMEDLADHIAEPLLYRSGKTRMPGFASTPVMAEALRSVSAGTREFYFSGIIDCPGFHDAMLATIGDLEEAAFSPDDLRRAARRPGLRKAVHLKKLEDLTAVWERYRCLLEEMAWVDDYQVMLAAAEHLPSSGLIGSAVSVLVYGFYDLNALQRRFLERCIDVKDTIAFVPFEQQRAFEFVKPTLAWLESRGFKRRQAVGNGDADQSPVLAHLRKHIFEETLEEVQPQDAVDFISAPGEVREVREIARRMGSEAQLGDIRSHEAGILLRNPAAYGAILRETFERLGVEPYMPEGKPLSETVEGRSVLLLVEAFAHSYARSEVMEFITFAPLRPDRVQRKTGGACPVHRWDSASVAAGIVEGRDEWEERLSRLHKEYQGRSEAGSYTDNDKRGRAFDAEDIDALRRFMRRLATLLDAFGKAGTWEEKSAALMKALRELTEDGPHTGEVTEAMAGLGELDRLAAPPSHTEFVQAVRECLDGEAIRLGRFQRQGPAVVSLTSARGIPFKLVVIPGMTEKGFPPVIRQDAILLDHEREVLNKAVAGTGPLHLMSRQRLDEERLLFRLAVGAADRRLLMTFPRLTIGTARERLPSSFVLAAVEALTGRKAYFDTIESTGAFHRVPLAEIAVAEPLEAVDQTEFDLAATLSNIRERTPEGILFLRRHSAFFGEGLRLESARWGTPLFTAYDGILAGAEARQLLERHHGIVGRKVSATRLETYAACPFGYLLSVILGVEPLLEPEQAQTISALDKGALVHRILWEFLTTLKEAKSEPLTVGPGDLRVLRRIAEKACREFEKSGVVGYPVMWELEKNTIRAWLDEFFEEETDLNELHPAYFEVRYGMRPRSTEESEISTEQPVPLEFGKRRILLRGRIDRIDLSDDGRRARIIDYKTGKPQAKEDDFQGGTALQLPLYLHAARHILAPLHNGIDAVSAEYYHLAANGKKRHIGFSADSLRAKRDELNSILDTIVDGIAGGLFFPLAGDLCRWCGFALACGPHRQQILERKYGDPRAEAFLRMRGEITVGPDKGGTE
jgi:ATP-dependent helicase/DNAse subunit B